MEKIIIYGVGLIGGSFALALKAVAAVHITGFGRRPDVLQEALRRGVIDQVGVDEAESLRDADLVLLAVPVGQMQAIMARIVPLIGEHTIVTDAGSTKGNVVAAAREILGTHITRFVPAHPIAGAENSGVDAAKADLYRDKRVVLTPLPENPDWVLEKVSQVWQQCGANVCRMSSAQHDRVFAGVSHLPHLLSFALVYDFARREDKDLYFAFAASGFRDFTRIAASHPEMWRDICLANRESLLTELAKYRQVLDTLEAALQARDGTVLEDIFESARENRRAWAAGNRVIHE